MGQFCHIIARDLSLDHVAIVTNPADKRCRIQQFDDEGGSRNRMTLRIEPKEKAHEKGSSAESSADFSGDE
jgi:hypothetical protein